MGMATILWCYLRNSAFKTADKDYHVAADLTGQANHLGVTIGADIIKQKLPENNGGFTALKFGKTTKAICETDQRTSHRPDPLRGWRLLHGQAGHHQFRQRLQEQRHGRRGEDGSDQPATAEWDLSGTRHSNAR